MRWPRPCAVVAVSLLAGATGALADDVGGYVELAASRTRTTSEAATGGSTELLSTSVVERFRLELTKNLFPTLNFQGGGLFERNDVGFDTGTGEMKLTSTKLRPYLALRFRSNLQAAEVTWERNEEDQKPEDAPKSGLVRERASAAYNWTPDALPSLKLRYERIDTIDIDRTTTNTSEGRYQVSSEYRPWTALRLYYNGAASDATDRFHENEIRTLSQAGRVTYSDAFWKGRVNVYSDYNVSDRSTRTTTSGKGEISIPAPPFGGLSAIDDTPEEGALTPNQALIDGNLTAGAGIDLGLPAPGGDTRPRNIGVDLGRATEVNTLYVWVDRDLRPEVSSSFVWQIYSSNDSRIWTFVQTVSAAPFGPFLTRFEIRFPSVNARYVKAVTRPLAASVPFSSDYPNILVTELETLITRPVAELRGRTAGTNHIYSLNVRSRLLETFPLYYELTYFLTKAGEARALYTVSNGISLSEAVGEHLSYAARVSREDGRAREGDRVAYLYTGSMTATPVPELRHVLVFSGTREEIEARSTAIRSLFLNNTGTLYRGVDVGLSAGWSETTGTGIDETRGTQIGMTATLVPHELVTVALSYRDITDRTFGSGGRASVTDARRDGEGSVAWRPLPTLYLFGSYRTEARTGEPARGINNYAVDWAPFPQGTLHFNFNYNETYRSNEGLTDRILTPSLRWDLTRRSFFDVSYQRITSDAPAQKNGTSILSGVFRVSY